MNKNNTIIILSGISFISYILGIILPFFETTKFWFFTDSISIVNSIIILFDNSDILLALITLAFSIVMPVMKYSLLLMYSFSVDKIRMKTLLHNIGKWSMTEVLAVAVFIVIMKTSGFYFLDVSVKIGAFFFGVAVITGLVSTHFVKND